MKAISTFNQEKALVGAFSVIVKTDGLFAALLEILTHYYLVILGRVSAVSWFR